MNPEITRLRRALATTLTALLLGVGLVTVSPALSASAHNYSVKADCVAGLSVTLTSYPASTTVAVTIDGKEEANTSFGGSWRGTFEWDSTLDHDYTVAVHSPDDPRGLKRWTFTKTGTEEGCPPAEAPQIGLSGTTCATPGDSDGTISFSLTGVTALHTVELLSGDTVVAETTSAGGIGSFTNVGAGQYTIRAFIQSGPSTTSAPVSVRKCAVLPPTPPPAAPPAPPAAPPAPSEVTVVAELGPCSPDTTSPSTPSVRDITATVSGLTPATEYTVELLTDDEDQTVIATATTPADASETSTHTFSQVPTPGSYAVRVLQAQISVLSDTIDTTLCPVSTLVPPEIELVAPQCDGTDTPTALTAKVINLDATETYFVRIVDTEGAPVAGVPDKQVTGSDTATVAFSSVPTPGSYLAQLLVGPEKQLAASSTDAVDAAMCLPILAFTGPSSLIPLGSIAALLLTLGGAIIATRRRSAAA